MSYTHKVIIINEGKQRMEKVSKIFKTFSVCSPPKVKTTQMMSYMKKVNCADRMVACRFYLFVLF